MKLNEAIIKLENLITGYKKQKFEQYPLTDGRIVSVDGDVVEGTAITEILADGTTQPLADETYTLVLSDGSNVNVTVSGGIITSIETPEEMESKTDNKDEEMQAMKSEIESLKTELKSFSEKFEALEKQNIKMSDVSIATYDIVKELVQMNVQEPVVEPFATTPKEKKDNEFLQLLRNNKKN